MLLLNFQLTKIDLHLCMTEYKLFKILSLESEPQVTTYREQALILEPTVKDSIRDTDMQLI